MKVYLDFQIWDYINKNEIIANYFRNQTDWDYFLSVAHLEELFKARLGEKDDKVGLTDELEITMRELAVDGVIKPHAKGVKFLVGGYDKAYRAIQENNTQESILSRAKVRREMDKSSYDPKDLFDGIKHDKSDEYKLVWETQRIINEISKINKNGHVQLVAELSDNENSLIRDLKKTYGNECAALLIKQLILTSNIEIKPAMYLEIIDDYSALEYVIEQLYIILTKCAYKRDRSVKHANSGIYDIQHSISATLCDVFITNDNGFADKFEAISYYLGIPIIIKRWDEIDKKIEK